MKRTLFLPMLAALALAACATQTPEKTVFELRATYDATVLAPAAHYAQLPTCPTAAPVCKQADAVTALQKADAAAATALDAAENLVRNNPKVDAHFAIAAATNAVSAVSAIITLYGIH